MLNRPNLFGYFSPTSTERESLILQKKSKSLWQNLLKEPQV
jgi:hypothetical protein